MTLNKRLPTAYSRVKKQKITVEVLAEMFKEKDHAIKVVDGLPEDAKLVRIMDCESTGDYWFVYESSEFELVGENEKIPEADYVNLESIEVEE